MGKLFCLVHDTLGHYGADKAYAVLQDSYYRLNMRCDLEKLYIPSCEECQQNKSSTTKMPGPLHPWLVPDTHGQLITMDFIGPLKDNSGYNFILFITDHLGANIRIVPTHIDITVEDLVVIFFNVWYCENGLPLDIILDWDKLFMSQFWKSLNALCGVKLKMSMLYHPQTDGTSEWMNKTITQALCFHVDHQQKGWAQALPQIQFVIMNTVNAWTGFSNFHLHLRRSPCVIPPLVPERLPLDLWSAMTQAEEVITRVNLDIGKARDNLLAAKVDQVH